MEMSCGEGRAGLEDASDAELGMALGVSAGGLRCAGQLCRATHAAKAWVRRLMFIVTPRRIGYRAIRILQIALCSAAVGGSRTRTRDQGCYVGYAE
jgi:hypothetical protein